MAALSFGGSFSAACRIGAREGVLLGLPVRSQRLDPIIQNSRMFRA